MSFAIFIESEMRSKPVSNPLSISSIENLSGGQSIRTGIFYPFAKKTRWWRAMDAYNFLCILFWIFGYEKALL